MSSFIEKWKEAKKLAATVEVRRADIFKEKQDEERSIIHKLLCHNITSMEIMPPVPAPPVSDRYKFQKEFEINIDGKPTGQYNDLVVEFVNHINLHGGMHRPCLNADESQCTAEAGKIFSKTGYWGAFSENSRKEFQNEFQKEFNYRRFSFGKPVSRAVRYIVELAQMPLESVMKIQGYGHLVDDEDLKNFLSKNH